MGKAKRTLGVVLAALMLVVTCMTYVPASAAVVLPTVKFVGLQNIPAAVGEEQTLFLTSDYTGNVQYQVFYLQRNDSSVKAVDGWKQVGSGWTTAADAKTPVEVKVPATTVTVAGNYSFAIRVKRAGETGTYSNSYGDYDGAYAFNYVFAATATAGLKDAKLASAEVAVGDKFVISGLTAGNSYNLATLNEATADRWAKSVAKSTTNTIEWAPTVAGSYVLDLQLVDAAGKVTAVKLFNVKVTDKFQIKSVTLLNSKQVAVTFNKAVQAGVATYGAQVLASYEINGISPTRVSLDTTGKVATLTYALGAVPTLGKYYQVDIADINSADGKATIEDYSEPLYLDDAVKPTATLSYSAPNATIDFSEPMACNTAAPYTLTGATVAVDGVAVTVSPTTYGSSIDSTADAAVLNGVYGIDEIVIPNLSAGTHRIDIVGAKDLAGNYMVDLTTTVTVAKDTVAPTVTSLTASGSVITAKFSEYVTGAQLLIDGGSAVAMTAADTTNTVYTYNANSVIATGSWKSISVVVTGAQDASSNPMANTTAQTMIITKDTTAPSLVSVATTENKVILKYNETLDNTAVSPTFNGRFVDADGVVHVFTAAPATASFGYDVNNDGDTSDSGEDYYLVLTFAIPTAPATNVNNTFVTGTKFNTGSYTFTIPNTLAKDTTIPTANYASADYTVSFTVAGTASTSATLGCTPAQLLNTPGTIVFTFTADLTVAALNVNNFKINGQPLPAGTKLYFYGSKSVVYAELPASYIGVTGSRTVSVANIVDEDGNTLTTAAKTGSFIALTENVSPVATSLILSTDKVIKVEMSENIANPITATGIEVYINGVKIDTAVNALSFSSEAGTVGTSSRLVITAASLTGTFAPTQTILVKFVSGCTLADTQGNTIAVGQVQK